MKKVCQDCGDDLTYIQAEPDPGYDENDRLYLYECEECEQQYYVMTEEIVFSVTKGEE